jgi:hypothetical protein
MAEQTTFNVEERIASLFQPDTLLPAQFLDTYRRKAHLEPETSLMLAVLEDAVACYQKYALAREGNGLELFREAEEWILQKDAQWLFSFDNICESLGMNPDYLREGLVRWKRNLLHSQPKAKVYDLHRRQAEQEEQSSDEARQAC